MYGHKAMKKSGGKDGKKPKSESQRLLDKEVREAEERGRKYQKMMKSY